MNVSHYPFDAIRGKYTSQIPESAAETRRLATEAQKQQKRASTAFKAVQINAQSRVQLEVWKKRKLAAPNHSGLRRGHQA